MGTLLYSSLFNGTFLNYYCRYTEKSQADQTERGQKGLLQNEIFCNSPHKNLFTLDDEKLPFCPFLRLFMHDSTRPNCWTQTAPMRYTVRDSHACRCGSPQNAGAVRTNYPLSQCSRPAGPVKPAGPHALGLSRICSGNSPFATHFRIDDNTVSMASGIPPGIGHCAAGRSYDRAA